MNLDALKAAFRQRAAELGIDAEHGATGYQAAALKAEQRKRTHHERQRQAVYADAAKPKAWMRYDNGQGAVDGLKVERQASSLWWVYPDYWRGGGRKITIRKPVSEDQEDLVSRMQPPDAQAFFNIRREARRLEGQVNEEVTRKEDKRAIWREAWIEDGAARRDRKQRRAVYLAALPVQQTFAFAY